MAPMPPAPPADHDTASGRPPRSRARVRPTLELRLRRRRLISYALFGASFVLMVNALVGEHGYLATLRAEREYRDLVQDLNARRVENQELLDRIHRLETDPEALEEAAREELGLIKPDENLFILKDRPQPTPPDGRR